MNEKRIDKDKINIINQLINEIYPHKEKCYIKLFDKANNKFHIYDINDLKDSKHLHSALNKLGSTDLFVSMNTFKSANRLTASNLFAINIIAIDIDYKKKAKLKNLEPKDIIHKLEADYFGQVIPNPTYIEYSNQLRLIYKLSDTVYIPKDNNSCKILCDRVSQEFTKRLKSLGAEVQKAEKFLRVPYSFNSKNNSEVQLIKYSDGTYKLKELQELWLNELPEWYAPWKEKDSTSSFNRLNDINSFNKARLDDFEKIQAYLNNSSINDYRKRLCFLYHNYSLLVLKADKKTTSIYKKAIEMTLAFNAKFNKPLLPNKMIGDTKFLRNKTYTYGNKAIIELLELEEWMFVELGLSSIFISQSKEEYNKAYYEKNKNKLLEEKAKKYDSNLAKTKYREKLKKEGKLTREEENRILRQKIKDLLNQGLTQVDIAKCLNYSTRTIKRHIAFMRKEGLLQ